MPASHQPLPLPLSCFALLLASPFVCFLCLRCLDPHHHAVRAGPFLDTTRLVVPAMPHRTSPKRPSADQASLRLRCPTSPEHPTRAAPHITSPAVPGLTLLVSPSHSEGAQPRLACQVVLVSPGRAPPSHDLPRRRLAMPRPSAHAVPAEPNRTYPHSCRASPYPSSPSPAVPKARFPQIGASLPSYRSPPLASICTRLPRGLVGEDGTSCSRRVTS